MGDALDITGTEFAKAWARARNAAHRRLQRDDENRARGLYLQTTQWPVLGPGEFIPIVADSRMPPHCMEMRVGSQRIILWGPEARAGHDPGDEDRS